MPTYDLTFDPNTYSWVPQSQLMQPRAAQIPPHILRALQQGGFADASGNLSSGFRWNADSMSIEGPQGSYYYGNVPDPSMGTDVVFDGQTHHFDPGVNPYIAAPGDRSYNGGVAPGSGLFISGDPNEIAEYSDSRRDRNYQGLARIAALVAGGAALAQTGPGPVFGGSSTPAVAGGAQTFPYTAGGPVTVSSIPGVTAGTTAGTGAGVGAGVLDSSGALIPGTESLAGGGGGMFENLFGGLRGNWGSLVGGLLGAIDANNQPDSTTSTYAPDPALTAHARGLLDMLPTLSGYTSAGIDPATTAAIERLQGFGGDAINPYLDRVFNTAADSTRSRLSSEFANSGRRVGGVDHEGARSEELQTLAASIYGGGYEAERNRELSSVAPLLAAGNYRRGVTQEGLDQDYTSLLRYLSSLNGLMPLFPGTNTQPLYNNPWAGFLGGAQLGSLFQGG